MNFASDNWSGIAPQISDALSAHAPNNDTAYGESELDRQVKAKFEALFETRVAVFFVGTGTVANSLAMALYAKPGGISLCHANAHMIEDECGAPELFSGGGRLAGVAGGYGKMNPIELQAKIDRFDPSFVHYGQPAAVSITQASEAGTVYSLDEIRQITEIAKAANLPVHMDGSRFANALVHLNASPAQMTWQSGVDILSFGGTKNGCWCAEALVLFNPEQATQMAYLHKRAGQLYSKSRFIAAQYDAYLEQDLWLDLARQANQMADKLRAAIGRATNARMGWDTQSNEVFCILRDDTTQILKDKGANFYPWPIPDELDDKPAKGEGLYRFVTSFSTEANEIAQVSSIICEK